VQHWLQNHRTHIQSFVGLTLFPQQPPLEDAFVKHQMEDLILPLALSIYPTNAPHLASELQPESASHPQLMHSLPWPLSASANTKIKEFHMLKNQEVKKLHKRPKCSKIKSQST
jgi:hypothetical protein